MHHISIMDCFYHVFRIEKQAVKQFVIYPKVPL